MFNSHSKFSVFGWWVAWIYLLSLTAYFDWPPPPLKPIIAFVERGIVVTDDDGTVKEEVTATIKLSEAATVPLNVVVEYRDDTAVHGRDFDARPTSRIIRFEPGEDEKTIGFGRRGQDVEIVGPTRPPRAGTTGAVESRSFTASIKDNPALEPVGDTGRLVVTIQRRESMEIDTDQPKAIFAKGRLECREDELPVQPIAISFDKPLPEDAAMTFTLFRKVGDKRIEVGRIPRQLKAGATELDLAIDEFPAEALAKHRVVKDGYPEADENYELAMMSSEVYPGDPLDITALNDDGLLEVTVESADNGDAFVVKDNGPPWEDAARVEWDLVGKLADGSTVDLGRGQSGGPPVRFSSKVRETSGGRRVKVAATPCKGNGGGGGGGGGSGGGGGGGGSGGGGACGGGCPGGQGQTGCGGRGPLVGPDVPGDYMLIVVNNERLHEPGDTITDRVRRALADESAKPYGNGAIIVNPKDEDSMNAEGGGPSKDKMFQPFERDGEDVAAQQKRVEEVIARKREAAQRPDLRAVVVWPERDLASGDGLKPVAGEDQQPVSFLFPGADPSYARNMRSLVPPKAQAGTVTIRSPKEAELTDHLRNVMRESGETPPAKDEGPGTDGEKRPPRDVKEALERSTG